MKRALPNCNCNDAGIITAESQREVGWLLQGIPSLFVASALRTYNISICILQTGEGEGRGNNYLGWSLAILFAQLFSECK